MVNAVSVAVEHEADGRLIEEGSHKELMRRNGKYAEMFRLQAEKYRESA